MCFKAIAHVVLSELTEERRESGELEGKRLGLLVRCVVRAV